MYVCVSMYVCILYVCTSQRLVLHARKGAYGCVNIYIYAYVRACIFSCMFVRAHIGFCPCPRIPVYIYISIFESAACIHILFRMQINLFVCTNVIRWRHSWACIGEACCRCACLHVRIRLSTYVCIQAPRDHQEVFLTQILSMTVYMYVSICMNAHMYVCKSTYVRTHMHKGVCCMCVRSLAHEICTQMRDFNKQMV
jgi:hypothetical protein